MKLDSAGELFIKGFESLRLVPYLDERGRPTNGWGNTHNVSMQMGSITEQEAENDFWVNVFYMQSELSKLVTIDINQNEFNALMSFIFNEGPMRLEYSTLLRKLNTKDILGASKEFDRWVYYHDPADGTPMVSKGLTDRRQKEKILFLTPVGTLITGTVNSNSSQSNS